MLKEHAFDEFSSKSKFFKYFVCINAYYIRVFLALFLGLKSYLKIKSKNKSF
jgi:hypothetical protein